MSVLDEMHLKRGEVECGITPINRVQAAISCCTENSHQSSAAEATRSASATRVQASSQTTSSFFKENRVRRATKARPTSLSEDVVNPHSMEAGSSFYNERHLLPRGVSLQQFDSTTSVFSWDNTEDTAGAFRLALRRIKYFIFQNDPDKCTDEPISITYRFATHISAMVPGSSYNCSADTYPFFQDASRHSPFCSRFLASRSMYVSDDSSLVFLLILGSA